MLRDQSRRVAVCVIVAGVGVCLSAGLAAAQPVSVTIDQPDYYLYQLIESSTEVGEMVFDPTDGFRPYVAADVATAGGGGIYRGRYENGILIFDELVAGLANPSGLVFTADGDLYFTQDFDSGLGVIRTPRTGAPYTVEMVITEFQTSLDDDPIAVAVAPAGFDGTYVDPGDLVIADRGPEGNDPNDFYVYKPNSTPGGVGTPTNPGAYSVFLSSTFNLAAYNTNDMNDLAFAPDGSALYAVFSGGQIIRLNANGDLVGTVVPTGVTLANLQAVGVNPVDGRIWVADDSLDEVWSIDPGTLVARRELKFAKVNASAPAAIAVHAPSIQFSPGGEMFCISDINGPSRGWVFKRKSGANNAPRVRVAIEPASGLAVVSGSTAEAAFDGSASDNGDGGTQGLTYHWQYLGSVAGVTIASPAAAKTNVTLPSTPGTYLFALRVSDGQAVDGIAASYVSLLIPPVSVEFPSGSYFKGASLISLPGNPGEVAFDPSDNNKLYIAKDDSIASAGGIYRIDEVAGQYSIGERVASVEGPSGIDFTPDGKLWYVRDGAAQLGKVETPKNGAPYTNTVVISQFQTSADDDPITVRLVPPGFQGPNVQPGDLLIADRGADGDPPNAVYVYSPSNPQGDPGAYSLFFIPAATLSAYNGNNINDMEFSPDGTKLYIAFDLGQIAELDANGTLLREIPVSGTTLGNLESIGVSPVDGKIWCGDDNLDQIWAVDPATGVANLEVSFRLAGESRPDFQINFHDPGLTFSPDGKRLVVSDTGLNAAVGWIWVLDVEAQSAFVFDFDGDGDVDDADVDTWAQCASGPSVPQADPNCAPLDVDGDQDVDMVDFATVQRCVSGAGNAYDPNCLN